MSNAPIAKRMKGMQDLFEDQLLTWRKLEDTARAHFLRAGYGEVRTPIVEETALFVRGVGESTDIVGKEMYAFADGKNKSVCLRPENTAAVVRAMLKAGRARPDTIDKVFYIGPMFRRERPQKERYRQFHQLGVETFGADGPLIDVEVMAMLSDFLTDMGIEGVTLGLNSLGDVAEREAYKEALIAYFTKYESDLSEDDRRRMRENPLRMLDSKDPKIQDIANEAPTIVGALGDESRAHYDGVKNGLEKLGVAYQEMPRLVRGLDYYSRTVFEALATTGLGSQNAVAAGGRYDSLVTTLGGKPCPAFGFAAGIERLVAMLTAQNKTESARGPDVYVVGADEMGRDGALKLAFALRRAGVSAEFDVTGRSVKAQMRQATRVGARTAIVLGGREMDAGAADVKFLDKQHVEPGVALTPEAIVAVLSA